MRDSAGPSRVVGIQLHGPSPILQGWVWPFLWILLVPVVTVPLHLMLLMEALPSCVSLATGFHCPTSLVLESLAPGLLNLVSFVWVLTPQARTRAAALVAGTLGVLRLVIPALLALVSGTTVPVLLQDLPGGGPNPELRLVGWFFSVGTEAAAVSRVLWVLSAGTIVAFPWLARAVEARTTRRPGQHSQPG